MPYNRHRPVLYGLFAAALFGTSAPITKVLTASVDPVALAALVYLGSGVGLILFHFISSFRRNVRMARAPMVSRSDIPWLAASTIFGAVLATVCLMYSLPGTPAATASLLLSFEGATVAFVAYIFFHEYIGRRVAGALGLVTIACMLLTYSSDAPFGISLSAVGILLATVFWGFDVNFSRQISARNPVVVVAIKGLAGGIILTALTLILGQSFPSFNLALAAMFVGLLTYGGLMTIMYLLSIRSLGSSRAGLLFATNPIFGVVVSWLIFRDIPGILFVVSLFFIIVSIYVLVTEKHVQRHRHPPEIHNHPHRHDDLHHDHIHSPEDPPVPPHGVHSHMHEHTEIIHTHHYVPDIHHRDPNNVIKEESTRK